MGIKWWALKALSYALSFPLCLPSRRLMLGNGNACAPPWFLLLGMKGNKSELPRAPWYILGGVSPGMLLQLAVGLALPNGCWNLFPQRPVLRLPGHWKSFQNWDFPGVPSSVVVLVQAREHRPHLERRKYQWGFFHTINTCVLHYHSVLRTMHPFELGMFKGLENCPHKPVQPRKSLSSGVRKPSFHFAFTLKVKWLGSACMGKSNTQIPSVQGFLSLKELCNWWAGMAAAQTIHLSFVSSLGNRPHGETMWSARKCDGDEPGPTLVSDSQLPNLKLESWEDFQEPPWHPGQEKQSLFSE